MNLHQRIGKALGELSYVNILKSGVVDAPETYSVDTIGEYSVSHVNDPSSNPLPNIKRDLRARFGDPKVETTSLLSYTEGDQSVVISLAVFGSTVWLND